MENIFNILSHSNIDVEIGVKSIRPILWIGSFGIYIKRCKKVTFIENIATFFKRKLLKLSILDNSIVFNDIIEKF